MSAFIIDETIIQIGSQHFWLWLCIEAVHKSTPGFHISKERNMFGAENFLRSLVEKYGRHTVFLRIELNHLMIIILVLITKRETVIYNMYTIGSSYLFIYIMQKSEIPFYSKLEVK